jgi:uncharacterized protein (DUF433 family)
MKFTRITVSPKQMGGVPCIRGLRIPVGTVVAMVADGMTETEILSAYPDLEREDLAEALRYAADAVRERELPPLRSSRFLRAGLRVRENRREIAPLRIFRSALPVRDGPRLGSCSNSNRALESRSRPKSV